MLHVIVLQGVWILSVYTLMWYEKQWVCEKDRERKLYVVENVKVIPASMEPADILLGQAPIQVLVLMENCF